MCFVASGFSEYDTSIFVLLQAASASMTRVFFVLLQAVSVNMTCIFFFNIASGLTTMTWYFLLLQAASASMTCGFFPYHKRFNDHDIVIFVVAGGFSEYDMWFFFHIASGLTTMLLQAASENATYILFVASDFNKHVAGNFSFCTGLQRV